MAVIYLHIYAHKDVMHVLGKLPRKGLIICSKRMGEDNVFILSDIYAIQGSVQCLCQQSKILDVYISFEYCIF